MSSTTRIPQFWPSVGSPIRNPRALFLRKCGPTVAGTNPSAACDAREELEETAKLYLLLQNRAKPLTDDQARALGDRG